jgi:hypothetical protein
MRSALRRFLAYVALAICTLFVLYTPRAIAGPLTADLGNGNSIAINDNPCRSAKVLKHIKTEFQAQFMTAVVVWEGKSLAACWTSMDAQNIFVIDETGDHGPLPFTIFQSKRVDM